MRIRGLNLVVGLSFFLVVSGDRSHAEEPVIDPVLGGAVYEKHCFRCHGSNGEGNGPDASLQIVPPVNFQSHESRSKSEEELRSAIIWGYSFSPMHGWWDKLSREEIWSVISYIRRMAPYQPSAQ